MATFNDTDDARAVLRFAIARFKEHLKTTQGWSAPRRMVPYNVPDDPFDDDDAQALIDAQSA